MLNDYPKLGSVCSGGRYDNLTGYYTDKKMPGIGISIGLTRLFSQLLDAGVIKTEEGSLAQVLIIPMNSSVFDTALKTASAMRNAEIKTDVYLLEKGMKPKMKYADRLGIKFAAIIGEDEVKNGVISLKDMKNGGEQLSLPVEEAIEYIKSKKL